MGKVKLYGTIKSPPVRSVLLTCKAIDLDIEFIQVDLANNDHKTKEYLEMNPQHSIPTMVDEGKIIWDSHAICGYLIAKYAKDDSLYPSRDIYTRALIDQRLHFDSGILFIRLTTIVELLLTNTFIIPQDYITRLYEAYDFTEVFLQRNDYIVGDSITIADFCCVATITSMVGLAPLTDEERYPRLIGWIKRLSTELPYYHECNGKGAESLVNFIKEKVELMEKRSN